MCINLTALRSVDSLEMIGIIVCSNNRRHRLDALPVLVQLLVKAMMSDLSGVYVGSVRLYNLGRDRPRGSAVETKVEEIRISIYVVLLEKS